MPNGLGLLRHTSATQSAAIVPMPRNPDQYYVFSVDAGPYKGTPSIGVHYSIVDMTQSGGLGAVTAIRNVPLLPLSIASEILLVIEHCDGRDYWLLAHAW